jgi:hypothetical protein
MFYVYMVVHIITVSYVVLKSDQFREMETKKSTGGICATGRILLIQIFKEIIWDGLIWAYANWCEHSNEALGTMRSEYFLYCHNDC